MADFVSSIASFTRPADTTAYAAFDLMANSTTAGSVTPLTFNFTELNRKRNAKAKRLRIQKSVASITNFIVRVHLFTAIPTVTNGDNGALAVTAANLNGYIGPVDIDFEALAAAVVGGPVSISGTIVTTVSAELNFNFRAAGPNVYGLMQALEAYTPASAEVFTVSLGLDIG